MTAAGLLVTGLALAASHAGLGTAAGDDSEDIRILIGDGMGSLVVRGSRLRAEGSDRPLGDDLDVRCHGDAVALPGRARTGDPATLSADGPIRVAGRALRGQLEVRCANGRWMAINVLPLEEYLDAVLGAEMPASFPLAALEAQAIAARSYALHRKVEATAQGRPYHLDATVLSQVYGGIGAEGQRTRQAVAATRGLVLAYGMLPVEAYFHSDCGGRTESGKDALGRDLPYLVSVPCPCATLAPSAHWTVRLSATELSKLAGAVIGRAPPLGLEVAARTAAGRARTLEVVTRHGRRMAQAAELRAALGWKRLPSLWFDVRRSGSTFIFEGRGSGHGAGLCQWGARVLAEKGRSYGEILAHYYPGTEIRRLY